MPVATQSHLTDEQQKKLIDYLVSLTPEDLLYIVQRMEGHVFVKYPSKTADQAPGYIMAAFLTDQSGMEYAVYGIKQLLGSAMSSVRDIVASLHGYLGNRDRLAMYKADRKTMDTREKRMLSLSEFAQFAENLPYPPKLTLAQLEERERQAKISEEERKKRVNQPIRGIHLKITGGEAPIDEEAPELGAVPLDDLNLDHLPDVDEEREGYQTAESIRFHEAMDRMNEAAKSSEGKKKTSSRRGAKAAAAGGARPIDGLNPNLPHAAAVAAVRSNDDEDDD